jgi:hypothetical protein
MQATYSSYLCILHLINCYYLDGSPRPMARKGNGEIGGWERVVILSCATWAVTSAGWPRHRARQRKGHSSVLFHEALLPDGRRTVRAVLVCAGCGASLGVRTASLRAHMAVLVPVLRASVRMWADTTCEACKETVFLTWAVNGPSTRARVCEVVRPSTTEMQTRSRRVPVQSP